MVLWLGFNMAAQQEPDSVKAPAVEAEHEENPAQGK